MSRPGRLVVIQSHMLLALSGCARDQDTPFHNQIWYSYGAVPPVAFAVHVTGVFGACGKEAGFPLVWGNPAFLLVLL